jgi:PncC family amidohydrolase
MSDNLFQDILTELEKRNLKLAIAESLTGGLLSSKFVSVAGASKVLLGSVVAYQNDLKVDLLDVPPNVLEARGAASADVAVAMASGVRERLAHSANMSIERVIGLSTTGVAGPGPEGEVAAGTVFVCASVPGADPLIGSFGFTGDRTEVREASAMAIAELLWDYLSR